MLTQSYFRGRVLVVLALFAVLGVAALWRQAVNGTISGTATDPSGAAIAGATVGVKNTATQVVRTVTTNAQGRYTIQTNVPVVVGGERAPGIQQMTPTAPGFFGTGEDYSVAGARPEGQPDRRLVLKHKRGPLPPQEAEQNALENLPPGSVDIGSDRASGRDVFGVA
jgi:hypothetical protein